MTPREALAYIESCRDSHVDWTPSEVVNRAAEEVQSPEDTVAFHQECVRGYTEALGALRPVVAFFNVTTDPPWPHVIGDNE